MLASAEKINSPYVSRLLRITLLTLCVAEAMLGGRFDDFATITLRRIL